MPRFLKAAQVAAFAVLGAATIQNEIPKVIPDRPATAGACIMIDKLELRQGASNSDKLGFMRMIAFGLAQRHPQHKCTIDDVREKLRERGLDKICVIPSSLLGTMFVYKNSPWQPTGDMIKSSRTESRGRKVQVWRLVKSNFAACQAWGKGMTTSVDVLRELRKKGCLVQRNDNKWTSDWNEQIVPDSLIEFMRNRGLIELVDRKTDDGSTYPAYVITDAGRSDLEKVEHAQNRVFNNRRKQHESSGDENGRSGTKSIRVGGEVTSGVRLFWHNGANDPRYT